MLISDHYKIGKYFNLFSNVSGTRYTKYITLIEINF